MKSADETGARKKRAPLAFLGRVGPDDWRRALILAEILAPPLARRGASHDRVFDGQRTRPSN